MRKLIFIWASILILLSPLSVSSQTVSQDTSHIAEEILKQNRQIDSLRMEFDKVKKDAYEKAIASANRSMTIATIFIGVVAVLVGFFGIFGYFRIREIKADYDKTERDLRESLREIKADYKETKAELMKRFEEDLEKVKEYEKDIKEIYGYIKEKRKFVDEETENFKKRIKVLQKEVPSDFSKEISELIEKDSRIAIEDYEKVMNKIFDEDIYFTMAYNYYVEKEYNESICELKKVIKLNPRNYEAYNSWGVVLVELNRHKEAIEKYRNATELNPDYVEAYNNWGVTLMELGEYKQAEEKYRKAKKLKPDYASAWYNMACIYSLQAKKRETLENLKKAIELDPIFKERAKKDEDFKNLWEDEDFKKLVE